jgi:PAS domain S-box-containing protein
MAWVKETATLETWARHQAAILLVDDYEPNLLALEVALAPLGHRLVRATSGAVALKWLLEDEFALILLDVMMPGLDGLETASLIRKREQACDTPIIFVSAVSRTHTDLLQGYALGAFDYLVKPYDPDILRAKVKVFVELHRTRAEVKRQAAILQARERERVRGRDELRTVARDARPAHGGAESPAAGDRGLAGSIPPRLLPEPEPEAREPDAVEPGGAREGIEAALARAERSERQFQLLVEAMPQIMWSLSPDGVTPYLNSRWYEYTGQDVARPFVEQWMAAVHPDDRERCCTAWLAAQANNGPWEMEYRLRRHDGAFRWHIARSVPQRDGEGKIVQWYGTATDIHDQRTAVRSRDDLLATVSHDLRDPLATIMLASSLLQGMRSHPTVERAASSIQRAAYRMEQLLRDLLDITTIESGHLSIEPARCRVDELIEAAVSMIAERATTKRLAIETQIAAPAAVVQCDKSRVLQVFSNLLGNACKFTAEGGTIAITARLEPGFVTFAVTDTGPGIQADQLGYVFDRFWKTRDQAKGGTGLGLAICQGIVKQHGGTIWVESTLGIGSTFSFTLPAAG